MATQFPSGEDELLSEINIVPFVDIILVILIIFMVTTPLILRPSLNVDLPKAVSGESSTPSSLSLTIDRRGVVFLNGKKMNLKTLQSQVKALVKKNPRLQAVISADQKASHGQVVRVMDLVKLAGVRRFAITTQKL